MKSIHKNGDDLNRTKARQTNEIRMKSHLRFIIGKYVALY